MEEESLFDKPCWGNWASTGKIIIRIIRIDLNLNLGIKITWNGLAFWKIRRKCSGSRAGKEFLDLMPNTQIHQRTDKLAFMKIRCLYSVKDPDNEDKKASADWENICKRHIQQLLVLSSMTCIMEKKIRMMNFWSFQQLVHRIWPKLYFTEIIHTQAT